MRTDLDVILEPFAGSFQPISIDIIRAAESELTSTFPSGLVSLWMSYGKCAFAGNASLPLADGRTLALFTIFGLDGDSCNVLKDYSAHPDYAENGCVPFADDVFNNRYVLSNSGEVLFIDYDRSLRAERVATSFDEFLDRIVVTPDDA